MAVLIDRETRILVQGVTGQVGAFQTGVMKEYGAKIEAGVTPGKGGQTVADVPVYDLVSEAAADHQLDAAISFVPAPFARDAALEILDAGIPFLVLTTEGIPEKDVLTILARARAMGARVLGPDTPGMISPGRSKLGVHPNAMFREGPVGVVSKSGSLSYEVGRVLTDNNIGQSSVVGIGGGPLWGTTQEEVLAMFEEDPDTEAVVLLGEVGGTLEHDAARFIAENVSKPVVALIVGRTAPEGAQMGHAGAIIEGREGTAESKIQALREAGALIAANSLEIPKLIKENIGG